MCIRLTYHDLLGRCLMLCLMPGLTYSCVPQVLLVSLILCLWSNTTIDVILSGVGTLFIMEIPNATSLLSKAPAAATASLNRKLKKLW